MVSGALADHLTGRADGQRILDRLFDGNVFTVRHGPHGWFGYQPLFRHLLAILLTLENPRAAMDLPVRAARWAATSADGTRPPRDTSSVARRQLPEDNHDRPAGPSGSEPRAVQELISRLSSRFPDVPVESVRQIVNASWEKFTDTPIRDFAPVLVDRITRGTGPVTALFS